MGSSTPTRPVNPSFWHFHNNEISHALHYSVRYNLVVGRALCNKALLILRKPNPST